MFYAVEANEPETLFGQARPIMGIFCEHIPGVDFRVVMIHNPDIKPPIVGNFVVTTLSDWLTGVPYIKDLSLREALLLAKSGDVITFDAVVRIDTPGEADYYRNGGILQYVLRSLVA